MHENFKKFLPTITEYLKTSDGELALNTHIEQTRVDVSLSTPTYRGKHPAARPAAFRQAASHFLSRDNVLLQQR